MNTWILLALLSIAGVASAAEPTTKPAIRIVLVGDSTVTDRQGWGHGFAELAGPDLAVSNTSAGGRSSKSFRAEGIWDKAMNLHGDYVLIQFGHNDQPGKGPDRETDAATTFKDNMVRYAKEVQAAGGKPILVTSLVRRRFDADGKIKSDLLAYVEGTKAAAKEAGVPLIDLHARSIDYFDKVGAAECEKLNPRDPKTNASDSTHLSKAWQVPVARLVIDELKKVQPELADKFKGDASR